MNHVSRQPQQRVVVLVGTGDRGRHLGQAVSSQVLKPSKRFQHKGVEMPPLLFPVGQTVGEQIDQHALAGADLSMEHESFG